MGLDHAMWGDRLSPRVDEPDGPHTIAGNDGATLFGLFKGLLYHIQNIQEFSDDSLGNLESVKTGIDTLVGVGKNIYTATFAASAVAAAQDCFAIQASSTKRIVIHYASLGQYSDFGDAAAEILSVLVLRGYTAFGSGGAAVTPSKVATSMAATTATVRRNDTTAASVGSPETLWSETFNVRAGWILDRPPAERIVIEPNQVAVVRITIPADELTMNGTLIYEEVDI